MGLTIRISSRVQIVVDGGGEQLSTKPETYTPEQLGRALFGALCGKHLHELLYRRVHDRVSAGETIPGWRLVPTHGPLEWIDEELAAEILKDHDIEPRRVMTPTEVDRADSRASLFCWKLTRHRLVEPTLMPDEFKGSTLLNDDAPDREVCL